MPQGGFEVRIQESIGRRLQLRRHDPAPGQQRGIRRLAEQEPQRERRDGEDGRPPQHAPQRAGELAARERGRRGEVYRPADLRRGQEVPHRADRVVDRDPAPVLTSARHRPPEPNPAGEPHTRHPPAPPGPPPPPPPPPHPDPPPPPGPRPAPALAP